MELHNFFGNVDIIRTFMSRRLQWTEHSSRMGDWRRAHNVLLGKPEGKRPHDRPKIRWKEDIILDLNDVGYEGDWKTLAQGVLMSWWHNASCVVKSCCTCWSGIFLNRVCFCTKIVAQHFPPWVIFLQGLLSFFRYFTRLKQCIVSRETEGRLSGTETTN